MTRRRTVLAGCLVVGGLLVSGCADFAQQPPPERWGPQQSFTPQAAPEPQDPGDGGEGGGGEGEGPNGPAPTQVPPPNGCTDYHPAVIGTCLEPVSAVAALPGDGRDPVALVAERTTGRIMRVRKGEEPALVATLQVDAGTDGGLTGLALSPNYAEDQLLFAYITTPTDNRLVRIARGDSPKPVLTGIPRGATGNKGTLALDHRGALLLATGDAGNPALAADQNSLAGKVLRLNAAGKPAETNPVKGSAIVISGIHAPGGICSPTDGSRIWLTDREPTRDVLYKIDYGKPLGSPAWTWPDRPGVAGCMTTRDMVMVGTSVAGNLQNLPLAADGTFRGKPQVTMAGDDGFGRLSAIDMINDAMGVAGTLNKGPGGTPVSSDDRAIIVVPMAAGGTGPD
jgi:glucose/arabinose dehydrogenase